MKSYPSLCIGVCKYKKHGFCKGCAMTKKEKGLFKKDLQRFDLETLINKVFKRQVAAGIHQAWRKKYRKKCEKRGLSPPTFT